MERKRRMEQVRIDAMYDALAISPRAEDAVRAANREGNKLAMKIGKRKETHFEDRMWAYFAWMVKKVKHATYQEDQQGIDFWVSFKKTKEFPWLSGRMLPVQVKSSPDHVEEFRRSKEYLENFRKKIVVVDIRLGTPKSEFKQKFTSELKRIGRIVENEKLDRASRIGHY